MSELNLTINGKSYRIGCDPGEEARVKELGAYIDSHVRALSGAGNTGTEANLMLLASIVLCDELFHAKEQLAALEHTPSPSQNIPPETNIQPDQFDEASAELVTQLAQRLESIVTYLEESRNQKRA